MGYYPNDGESNGQEMEDEMENEMETVVIKWTI